MILWALFHWIMFAIGCGGVLLLAAAWLSEPLVRAAIKRHVRAEAAGPWRG